MLLGGWRTCQRATGKRDNRDREAYNSKISDHREQKGGGELGEEVRTERSGIARGRGENRKEGDS